LLRWVRSWSRPAAALRCGVLCDREHLDVLQEQHRLVFSERIAAEHTDHVDMVTGRNESARRIQFREVYRHRALASRHEIAQSLHIRLIWFGQVRRKNLLACRYRYRQRQPLDVSE
jgi:uncharacterized protein (DUF305 family)